MAVSKYKFNFYGIICLSISLIFCVPIFYTILSSFKSSFEIVSNSKEMGFLHIKIIPEMASLEQYADILIRSPQYLKLFWNSVFYAAIILPGTLCVSLFTAYALYRISGRISNLIFTIYTLVMLMPFQVVCVPNFMILSKLGLLDSGAAIILPAVFGPFGTFLMRRFLTDMSFEYIESAQIDGANEMTIALKVVFPMAKNGVAALSAITFAEYWNMVEQPLVFLKTQSKEPLSSFLAVMADKDIGIIFAASTFYLSPAALFFLYNSESFVKGIQLSGLK